MGKAMALSEFEMIARYFSSIGKPSAAVDVSVGDDCALLCVPRGQRLALSIDSLVAGVHFPEQANAGDISQRALAVAISDLAAMGASPLAFTLALTLPDSNELWLRDFATGLQLAAEHYQIPLIGGDTTRGPLSVSIQVQGTVPDHQCLLRSSARSGDSLYVTGSLGDAAAALQLIEGSLAVADDSDRHYFRQRFYQPEARVILGEALLGVASAAIDISDGLLADAGHIAAASAMALDIYDQQIPLSAQLLAAVGRERARQLALSGGDDYELCFSAPPGQHEHLMELSELLDVPITEVGRVVSGAGVRCLDTGGGSIDVDRTGYQHFNNR